MDCHENPPFLLCHCDHVSDVCIDCRLNYDIESCFRHSSATLELFGPQGARIDELSDLWSNSLRLMTIDFS